MKLFNWDDAKNELLISQRGISFEEIVFHIASGRGLLDIVENSNQEIYKGQKIFIVRIHGYVYAVPFIENEKEIFLKTIYPSRKLTKMYAREGDYGA